MSAPHAIHDLYHSICRKRSIVPDPTVATALKTGASHLNLTSEPHITLVLHIFSTSDPAHISATHLTLTPSTLPASTIGTLATYLSQQTHITHLTISNVALPENATEILLTALTAPSAVHSPLSHLTLANVGLSSHAAVTLAPLLSNPLPSLVQLDLSNNAANHAGVHALQSALHLRPSHLPPLKVSLSGNLVTIETLNSVTHGVGAALALLGGGGLTRAAIRRALPISTVASIATFCASLFTLLASSCAYHSVFRYPRLHAALRRADHCSIFLLIAGSYTPFIVAYLLDPPTIAGPLTLAAVWTCAAAGMARSAVGQGSNRSRALFALSTGWMGVISIGSLIERMQRDAFYLVLAGGLVYSIGLIFYLLGKRIPALHVLWHVAVMIGGSLHYFALWKYVVHADSA